MGIKLSSLLFGWGGSYLGASLLVHGSVLGALIYSSSDDIKQIPTSSIQTFDVLVASAPVSSTVAETRSPQPAKKKPKKRPVPRSSEPALEKTKPTPAEEENVAGGGIKGDQLGETEAYLMELRALVEARKSYPKEAIRFGQHGTVIVQVKILRDGRFMAVEVSESSRHFVLDQAAKRLLSGIGRFRPIPLSVSGDAWTIRFPIEYVL